MIVYMLRNNATGLFYRRTKGSYSSSVWVEHKKASIWTSKHGPVMAMSYINHRARRKLTTPLEVIPFQLTEITDG